MARETLSTIYTFRYQRIKGVPRPASTYRGARRNAMKSTPRRRPSK